MPWAVLVKAAKIPSGTQRRLVKAAQGATAAGWYGVIGAVPRSLWRTVETLQQGRWTNYL
jgi:hypothetical protein